MPVPPPGPNPADCKGCMHWFNCLGTGVRLCNTEDGRCPGKQPHPARMQPEPEPKRKERAK